MFYIIEIQESEDGTPAILTYSEETKNKALSKWHDILHYAAVSKVHIHTVYVTDAKGQFIARESYTHYSDGTVVQ